LSDGQYSLKPSIATNRKEKQYNPTFKLYTSLQTNTTMSKLTIVARITAKPDKIDFVKNELKKLIPPTRKENGCINYDLHQDNEHPSHFLFYENWESRELWQAHMESPHLKEFQAASEGSVEEVIIYEMTPAE